MATTEPGPAYGRLYSHTQLATFRRCPRKWWLGWYRGLRLRRQSPVGVLAIGDRCHRALRAHYDPADPRDLLDALEDEIRSDRTALLDGMGPDDDNDWEQFDKEANLERVLLRGYRDWLASTGADAELEVISAETYLAAPLAGPWNTGEEPTLIGQLDVRVRRLSDGARLFLDHKVVGQFPNPALLPQNTQMLHYGLLERLAEPDASPVAGALYNQIRRVRGTRSAKPPFYLREEVRHNARQIASYYAQVRAQIGQVQQLERMLPEHSDLIIYPNPTRDCAWDCPFLPVCPMFDDGSRAEDMLEQLYVVGDPYDYYRLTAESGAPQ